MDQQNIQLMAWAPFAEGQKKIFTNNQLVAIGKKYDKTAAQVILGWLRAEEIIAIPKSVHLTRIQENFDIDGFTLSEDDIEKIRALDLDKPLILDITALNEVYRLHGLS